MVKCNNESLEILKLLIGEQEGKPSIRKISKLRDINYKSAYEAIKKLEKNGIVKIEKLGNTSICTFTKKFDPSVFEAEYKRREDLLKNKNLWVVQQRLSKLNKPFIALLFGSYVKGSATKKSDVDILAITDYEKEIRAELDLIPMDIHLSTATQKEFISMSKSREFTFVSEAMKKNIILVGIEEYYRLLENAQH